MALNLGELLVRLGIDVSGFERNLEKSTKDIKATAQKWEQTGAGLTRSVSLPIIGIGAAASKAAITFESAFAGVRKTVTASEQEFTALESGIRKMATTMPASTTEISRVAEAAGQLGIKTENILSFSETMIKLGTSTNLASDEAATALARLANITGLNQTEFDKLGSAIVALGNNFATTEREIVEMSLRIAASGKTIGLTEPQILAFATALSSVGIEAELGGSAISRVMIDIAKEVKTGGDKLATFAAVAGMSADQFTQAFQRDAAGAIVTFVEGLGKIQASGGNVFGVLESLDFDAIRVHGSLLSAASAGDLLRQALDLGTKSFQENNALTKEASQRYATTASQMKILWNEVNEAAIKFGEGLTPALSAAMTALRPLLDSIQNAAKRFGELNPETQTSIIKMGLLLAAVGPAVTIIGKLSGGITGLLAAGSTLGFAFAAWKGGAAKFGEALAYLGLHPVGAAIVGIGALAGVIYAGVKAHERAKKEADANAVALGKLAAKYDEAEKAVNRAFSMGEDYTAAAQEQKKVIQEIGLLFPSVVKQWDEHGQAVELDTEKLRANTKAAQDNTKVKAEAAFKEARQEVESINRELDRLTRTRAEVKSGTGMIGGNAKRRGVTDSVLAEIDAQIASQTRALESARERLLQAHIGAFGQGESYEPAPVKPPEAPKKPAGDKAQLDETAALATIDAAQKADEEKQRVQDAFDARFQRSQEDALEAFSRAQEDATAKFKAEQDRRLTDYQANLDEQLGKWQKFVDLQTRQFDQGQQDAKIAFEASLKEQREAKQTELDKDLLNFQRAQEKEKESFQRHQDNLLQLFKDDLDKKQNGRKATYDKELYDLKKAHGKELDAIRDRYDAEALLRDQRLAAKVDPLKKAIESIRAQEEAEEKAERYEAMVERIKKAEENLADALKAGTMKEIGEARKALAEARSDQEAMITRDARKAQVGRLQDQIEAAQKSAAEADKAAKIALDKEIKAKQEQQEIDYRAREEKLAAALEAYKAELDASLANEQLRLKDLKIAQQKELEDLLIAEKAKLDARMKAFDAEAAADKTNFERRQAEAKRQDEEDLKRFMEAKKKESDASIAAFKTRLDEDETTWKRNQQDHETRYKRELEDLQASFADKLDAQRMFLANWNAMVASMRAMVPPAGGEGNLTQTPNLQPPNALVDSTRTTVPPAGGEMTGIPDIPTPSPNGGGGGDAIMMAEGGIARRPVVMGEAGPEVFAPLDELWQRITSAVNAAVDRVAGMRQGESGMTAFAGMLDSFMSGNRFGGGPATAAGVGPIEVRVYLGQREFEDIWIETKQAAERKGRA